MTAEDIAKTASRYTFDEIDAAVADGKEAGAARWGWMKERLKNRPRPRS